MKPLLKIIGILFLIFILFKGWIFRQLITYSNIGSRENIEITHSNLLEKIRLKSSDESMTIEKIVQISRSITIQELSFSRTQISRNPNDLFNTKKANCIGYAAMFNSIANHLIHSNNLELKYAANHQIGRLELLGFNLHAFFNSPFFRDHDYNEIIDLQKRKTLAIDPSVTDYLGINYVRNRNLEFLEN